MLAFRTLTLSMVSLLLGGCGAGALLHPFLYAPRSETKPWIPSYKEKALVNSVQAESSLEIPLASDVVSLGDLFAISLHNSPETRESWASAREAAATYAESLSSYFPTISFDGQYLKEKLGIQLDNIFAFTDNTSWGPEVELSYLLWDFGTRKQNAELYFQALESMNWKYNEKLQKVLQSVAKTYYDHLYAKSLLSALEADLLNAKEIYESASLKFETGIFSETDMLQAKTNFLQKQVDVTAEIREVQNSFINLLKTVGIPCTASFETGSFPEAPVPDSFASNLTKLLTTAWQERPDYLASKAFVLSQEAVVKKVKAEVLPKVAVTAEGGQQWYKGGFTDHGNYMVQLDLTFPIFSGFYYVNQIRAKESALQKAIAEMQQVELAIVSEVKIAYNNFMTAKQQIKDTKSYLDAARIEFMAMKERYSMGVVTILDILSAFSFLSDARAKVVRSEREYFVSLINIAFATGMLSTATPHTLEAKR